MTALQESQVSSRAITLLAAMLLLVANFGLRDRRPALWDRWHRRRDVATVIPEARPAAAPV